MKRENQNECVTTLEIHILLFLYPTDRIGKAGDSSLSGVSDKGTRAPKSSPLHKLFRPSRVKGPIKDRRSTHHSYRVTKGKRSHFRYKTRDSQPRSKSLASFSFRQISTHSSGGSAPESIQRCSPEKFKSLTIGRQTVRRISTVDISKMANLTLEGGHQMVPRPGHIKPVPLHMVIEDFSFLINQGTDRKKFGAQWNKTTGTPCGLTRGKGPSRRVEIGAKDPPGVCQIGAIGRHGAESVETCPVILFALQALETRTCREDK
jgi:hypothetical protein